MAFVLDASVALAWHFEDESPAYADRVLDRLKEDDALVPAVWPLEMANGLLTAERRGRLSAANVAQAHGILVDLPISVGALTLDDALGAVVDLARAHGLSAYDAAYLDLAMREGLSLATQDNDLRVAATRAGVALVD